jgi:hypothetical protein
VGKEVREEGREGVHVEAIEGARRPRADRLDEERVGGVGGHQRAAYHEAHQGIEQPLLHTPLRQDAAGLAQHTHQLDGLGQRMDVGHRSSLVTADLALAVTPYLHRRRDQKRSHAW